MGAATSEEIVALSTTQVVVHPLVLLSVTDHAARVAKGAKKRVVGVLLGQDCSSSPNPSINVANSFAIPFEEDERDPRTWFLDHNYVENMCSMFRKISAKETLVGWYHTGPKLRASDLQINEVFKRYCKRPVMIIVDARPEAEQEAGRGGSVTDAYFAVEEIKDDGTATQKTFMHVPSSIEAEESEEIGVEHLLRDIKDLSTGTLSARVAARLSSLQGLQARLGEIRDYLAEVVAGKLPVNHQIIYNLQDIFNLLPNIDLSSPSSSSSPFTSTSSDAPTINGLVNGIEECKGKEVTLGNQGRSRTLTIATNDQLLVMYVSSLIRAVIALHRLVNNKLENQSSAASEDDMDVDGSPTGATVKDGAKGGASSEGKDKKPASGAGEEGKEKKDDTSRGL